MKQTVDDQIKMADFRLQHGFTSFVDEMLKINNDLTTDEALSAIKENIQINKSFGVPTFGAPTQTQPSLFSQLLSMSGNTGRIINQSLTGSPGGPGGVSTSQGKISSPPIPGTLGATPPSGAMNV